MLKACWDCLVGDGRRTEDPYNNIELNGNVNRAPPWPTPKLQNEKMFILPKILSSNDRIIVQGMTTYERRQLTVGLVTGFDSPDHSNVACQLRISFNDPDNIAIQIVENGNTGTVNDSIVASDYFAEPQFFEIQFRVRSGQILDVAVGESFLDSVHLKHNANIIRFLTVHGDVEKVSKLEFNFG